MLYEFVHLFEDYEIVLCADFWLFEAIGLEYGDVDVIERDVVASRLERKAIGTRCDLGDVSASDEVDDGTLPNAWFTEEDDVDILASVRLCGDTQPSERTGQRSV